MMVGPECDGDLTTMGFGGIVAKAEVHLSRVTRHGSGVSA